MIHEVSGNFSFTVVSIQIFHLLPIHCIYTMRWVPCQEVGMHLGKGKIGWSASQGRSVT